MKYVHNKRHQDYFWDVMGFVRLPLILFVIFAHQTPGVVDMKLPRLFSGEWFYNLIAIMFSHLFPYVAVPAFFFISGYLFFRNMQHYSFETYKKKMSRRVTTLLVPYFAWNLLAAILYICRLVLIEDVLLSDAVRKIWNEGYHLFVDHVTWQNAQPSFVGLPCITSAPIDSPLWYLRELIIITLLSPMLFFFLRRIGKLFLAFLFVLYLFRLWPPITWLGCLGIFYYSLGGYFSLSNINVVSFSEQKSLCICCVALILLPINIIFYFTPYKDYFLPFLIIAYIFAFFSFSSMVVKIFQVNKIEKLVNSIFFVYAIHLIPFFIVGSPLIISKKIITFLLPVNSFLLLLIDYLIIPFLTFGICFILYEITKMIFPKASMCFTGGK